MSSAAGEVRFGAVCKFLDGVVTLKSSRARKTAHVERFLASFRDGSAYRREYDMYALLRLVLPQLDIERTYMLKESNYARLLKNVLLVPDHIADPIIRWRQSAGSAGAMRGGMDFALIVRGFLEGRCPSQSTLTMRDVNAQLDALAAAGTVAERQNVLSYFVTNGTAHENMWIVRMMLKDLKISTGHETFLHAFHPDAVELFNVNSSLREVCTRLVDTSVRLAKQSVQVFHNAQAMLATRRTVEELARMVESEGAGALVAETKFDGERVMIHMRDGAVRYFSRAGKEHTDIFAPKFDAIVRRCVPGCKACVIDGEMLAYDSTIDRILPFGSLKGVAKSSDPLDARHLLYMAFDVLLVDGVDVSQNTLADRRRRLAAIVQPLATQFELVAQRPLVTRGDVVSFFDDALEAGEEGLIVKHTRSVYRLDKKREQSQWYKLKAEYNDELDDQLDLVVVGGYMGRSQRAGIIGEFLLAAIDDSEPGRPYYTVVRVGTGYSMDELRALQEKLRPYWQPVDSLAALPHELQGLRVPRPHYYIAPAHSVVLSVKCGGVLRSDRYSSRFTLRFPRCTAIRLDKRVDECLTMAGLRKFYDEGINRNSRKRPLGNLVDGKRNASAEPGAGGDYDGAPALDGSSPSSRARSRTPGRAAALSRSRGVLAHFLGTDTSAVARRTALFAGKTFCVLSGTKEHTKADLERLIAEHGGSRVQNVTPDVTFAVAGDMLARVHNQVRLRTVDVVRASWITDSVHAGRLLPLVPEYRLFLTDNTLASLRDVMDKYGDLYADGEMTSESVRVALDEVARVEGWSAHAPPGAAKRRATPRALEQLLELFDEDEHGSVPMDAEAAGDAADTERELVGELDFLHGCRVWFAPAGARDGDREVQFARWRYGLIVRMHGGSVLTGAAGDDRVPTHVVVDPEAAADARKAARADAVQRFAAHSGGRLNAHYVTAQWLDDSVAEGRRADERYFDPVFVSGRAAARASSS